MHRYYHSLHHRRTRIRGQTIHPGDVTLVHRHVVPKVCHEEDVAGFFHRLPLSVSGYLTTQFLFLHDITSLSVLSSLMRHMIKSQLRDAPRLVLDISQHFCLYYQPLCVDRMWCSPITSMALSSLKWCRSLQVLNVAHTDCIVFDDLKFIQRQVSNTVKTGIHFCA
jgi:hypothetical protein